MAIWKKDYTLEDVKKFHKNMSVHVGIEFTAVGDDYLEGTMPVDHRTQQPMGLLHGGASCVLAETLGSIASYMCIKEEGFVAVGQSLEASHMRPVTEGNVRARAVPIHLGKKTHVWEIRIYNSDNKLVCFTKLTTAIIPVGR